MGRREDFKKTLEHNSPENMILDLGGNPLSTMEGDSPDQLLRFLGYEPGKPEFPLFGKTRKVDERILNFLGTDTRAVGTIVTPQNSQYEILADDLYIDEWGIKRKFTGMYWDIVEYPLKGASAGDLDSYKWPDPKSIDLSIIDEYAKKAKLLYEETDYIICGEHPVYGVFEIGCWMCGFDDFLIKMAIDETFVRKFFDRILEYQRIVSEVYYKEIGKYIHFTSSGDDFATQASLFMSPDIFRQLIKPYLSERVRFTKQLTDAAFLHHSCGNVHDIIDDLIDCGVDILNPIQPTNEDMTPKNIKSTFGNRIVFHGGLDTQEILPYGTEESIREAVSNLVDVMNKDGGYVFAAAHNIQPDVPPENVVHMFKAAREFGSLNKTT